MARHVAKSLLAAERDRYSKCLVQLSYAIGVVEPTSVTVWMDGEVSDRHHDLVQDSFDLTPLGMIEYLNVNDPKNLLGSTNYGHFGKPELSWEKLYDFG